jgi:putative autoinducer-2 (AI-2) aldolase
MISKGALVMGKSIKGMENLDWGMRNRLSRIIQDDGHCFILPIDHGYFQGPTHCLERPWETIKDLLPHSDALFVTRGVLRSAVKPDIDTPIILRVSGGTSILGDLTDEVITTAIDDIVRLNVAAVGISVFVGTKKEKRTLDNLARLVNDCERHGIPVMGITAVGKELEKRDARYLGLCCRILAELGAKVVKTYWCEGFEKVTDGCPVPVVMAGGPKCETELEVFEFVHDGMSKGAIGVNLGRNVWQNPNRVAIAKGLKAIIHSGADPKEAHEIFNSEKKKQ